jgi:hypothetical protein
MVARVGDLVLHGGMMVIGLLPNYKFMAIYKLTESGLTAVKTDTMSNLGIRERQDLQSVLRDNIDAVSPGTLIVAEEFSEWEDSKRRIDLLGIDPDGSIVVIELKRTNDGGHMDLQAVRYAAMVSALTFERVAEVFASHLAVLKKEGNAIEILLNHLGWDAEGDDEIGKQVRIILVSADFGQEITTTVLWLNAQGLEIRCVRMVPYQNGAEILFDIQQVIPIPEASDYMVKLRAKGEEKKATLRQNTRDLTYYDLNLAGHCESQLSKRQAIFSIAKHLVAAGISPDQIQAALPSGQMQRFYGIDGEFLTTDDFLAEVSRQAIPTDSGKLFLSARWFIKDEDLIQFEGRTYVFSKMWGPKTHSCMEALSKAFPDQAIQFSLGRWR